MFVGFGVFVGDIDVPVDILVGVKVGVAVGGVPVAVSVG